MKRLVVGLDPGTGKSSPTGFACFDPDSREIVHTEEVTSKAPEYKDRYREIASRVRELLECIDPELDVLVACESFVMRGKGGEILARLTGALMAAVPAHHRFTFVANTTVKKAIAGHGHAEKSEVAEGVKVFFKLKELKVGDISDALAIGITGHLKETT